MTATAADDLAARHELDGAVVFTHPLRTKIIELAGERGRVSPRDLAGELGEPLDTVSYHLRVLARLGFLTPDPLPGEVEHYYTVDGPAIVTALDRLSVAVSGLRGRLDRHGTVR